MTGQVSQRYELKMLEFHFRQAGEKQPPRTLHGGLSFLVRYTAPGAVLALPACERHCATESAALNFCVILRNLGGHPREVLQLIHGQPDAVLDGHDLEAAIDRQRIRLETEAVPPWR
jgi:hypothetical protein